MISEDEILMKEFELVRAQKEMEERKREEELEQLRQNELMSGNPLLDGSAYSLNKRWFEDTVFKNQAKTNQKNKNRFINDTVRSDFHKRFLSKYILN